MGATMSANEKALSVCGAQGFRYHLNSKHTAVDIGAQEKKLAPADGKALAMWLYNFGICDFAFTRRAFDRRPDWRHA